MECFLEPSKMRRSIRMINKLRTLTPERKLDRKECFSHRFPIGLFLNSTRLLSPRLQNLEKSEAGF